VSEITPAEAAAHFVNGLNVQLRCTRAHQYRPGHWANLTIIERRGPDDRVIFHVHFPSDHQTDAWPVMSETGYEFRLVVACPECEGTGYIQDEDADEAGNEEPEDIECDTCEDGWVPAA